MNAYRQFILTEIRIENFRSLVDVWLPLREHTVLIGANNSGKTSLLDAISLVFLDRTDRFSVEDVFLRYDESQTPRERAIRVDLRIEPHASGEFSDEVRGVFGSAIQLGTENDKDFIAIRAEFLWDRVRGDYMRSRYFLQGWARNKADAEKVKAMSQPRPRGDHLELFLFYFLDASRDISKQLHSRRSFWGKMAEDLQLDDKAHKKIEKKLQDINALVRQESPVLEHIKNRLDELYRTVTSEKHGVEIMPLPKHLRDLVGGMDILFKTKGSPSFPISRHGMGTRSMAALLVFHAFIEWQLRRSKKLQPLPIVALEEPEAHLHPHAQRALFDQIANIKGQKLVSTHSPHVVSHAQLYDFVLFRKDGDATKLSWVPEFENDGRRFLSTESAHKMHKFVQRQNSELFFSRFIVLFEGETEQYALPIFAEAFFGCRPDSQGLSFVNVTGVGNYDSFLKISERLRIPWVIFSDAEQDAKRKLNACFNRAGLDQSAFQYRIIFLPEGNDFEKYLIEEGYISEISLVIEEQFGQDALHSFKAKQQGQRRGGGHKIDYTTPEGEKQALNDFIDLKGKTFFGRYLAEKIITERAGEDRIPQKVKELFTKVKSLIDRY